MLRYFQAMFRSLDIVFGAAALLLCLATAGCQSQIGSSCVQSIDCSSRGERVCDTSQPGGYCTILNCASSSCPDHAACVALGLSVPGCLYIDYQSPARSARALCLAHCGQDSDCRIGYVCRDPRQAPWNGAILDNNQGQRVCLVAPDPLATPMTGVSAACPGAANETPAAADASADVVADAADSAAEVGATGGDAAGETGPADALVETGAADGAREAGPVDASGQQ